MELLIFGIHIDYTYVKLFFLNKKNSCSTLLSTLGFYDSVGFSNDGKPVFQDH